jgi:pimeloyl-ACP methyl ester carboxylesterase
MACLAWLGEKTSEALEVHAVKGTERVPSGLAGFTSTYVDVGDLTIHAVTGGDGPVVVLLHGFAQTWRSWRAVMPILAERYRVIAPDLRGVGGSTVTFDGFDKRTMAGDVAGLLDALDIPAAAVVGHDIGGMVAYAFAKSYPSRISKLGIAAVLVPEQAWYGFPLLDAHSPWWFRFHSLPLVPERLIAASLSFYFDWFYDFHDPGQNYDSSGITASDRKRTYGRTPLLAR